MKKFQTVILLLILLIPSLPGCSLVHDIPPTGIVPSSIPSELSPEQVVPTPASQPPPGFFPSQEERIPVIYSHGGGPCDIGAMVFLAMHPQVDWLGLVLTRGEFHPEIAIEKWSVFLYDVLHSTNTAIALGSTERMDPVSHDFPDEWRGGADDFWGLTLPLPVTEFEVAYGPDLIVQLVNNSPDKVTLVGMASMIDLALAIQQDPGIIENIAQVVIMGGAFTVSGNLHEGPEPTDNIAAEWNMYIDPEAAHLLFTSGVPLSVVPLDAIQYLVQPEDVAVLNSIGEPGVEYVAGMWSQQNEWAGGAGFLIWDTITITAVTNPENFSWTYDGVDVVTEPGDFQGQTIPLLNGSENSRYATGADYGAILELLFNTYQTGSLAPVPTSEDEGTIPSLGGVWEGDTGEFHITFQLDPLCRLNEKCGTFEIPEFSLTGDVIFYAIKGNIFEFRTENLSSGAESDQYEYLQLLEDGRLHYSTTGAGITNDAFLVRK